MEVPKATAQKGDADTPSRVPTNGLHTAFAKVETPLKDLNNDTAAAPSAVPTKTDLQGPPSKNGLKIASLERRIRELEAELDSQRRQDPDESFFYIPPLGLQKDRPLPLLKWPIIRGERIKELDQLSQVYSSTHQVENIVAAKAYHAQFPADEYVPTGTISFAEGKMVGGKTRTTQN